MIHEDITLGPVRLILGDCLKIAPTLEGVDAVITDPVWPTCPEGLLAGGDGMQDELLEKVLWSCADARVWVVVMGFDCDPRWLFGAVPSFKPFIRTQQLPYAMPGYRGRLLAGDEIAYIFGEIPDGTGVIPGRIQTEAIPKAKRAVNHPCPRSATHMSGLIRWWTLETETVLDPFMGSGTTLIAAIRTGRRAIGIEIDPTHYRTAVERVRRELAQPTLGFESKPQPKQEALL